MTDASGTLAKRTLTLLRKTLDGVYTLGGVPRARSSALQSVIMVYASTLLFSFLLASAFAVPTPGMGGELEGRSSSMCKTLAEGYLSTTLLKSSDGSLTSEPLSPLVCRRTY